jgi:hypothetical protein
MSISRDELQGNIIEEIIRKSKKKSTKRKLVGVYLDESEIEILDKIARKATASRATIIKEVLIAAGIFKD